MNLTNMIKIIFSLALVCAGTVRPSSVEEIATRAATTAALAATDKVKTQLGELEAKLATILQEAQKGKATLQQTIDASEGRIDAMVSKALAKKMAEIDGKFAEVDRLVEERAKILADAALKTARSDFNADLDAAQRRFDKDKREIEKIATQLQEQRAELQRVSRCSS